VEQGYYAEYRRIEDRHWWFRGRRRIVLSFVDRLPLPEPCATLDAGCGSGRMLDELAARGSVRGVDVNPAAVAAAGSRGHSAGVAELGGVPFEEGSFDLILCLDVLEHLEDDVAGLRELARVARPGAHLLLTVPAYPRLWSSHDEAAGHQRRYTARTLRTALAATRWRPVELTHFNLLLLAPAAALRLSERVHRPKARGSHLTLTPRRADRLLEAPLGLENRLLRRGISLPAGLSLVVVARR